MYAQGVQVFHQAKNLNALNKLHANKFLRRKLIKKEQGSSFLDLISESEIAYVICLVKNSQEVWKQLLC
jgi:hypothetical protein